MPEFDDLNLTPDLISFCYKILSSDALAALILDRLKKGQSASVIRMSDGERAFMAHAQGAAPTAFMKDPSWLARYGLTGIDQKKVGKDLLWAGQNADFLACTISGVFDASYRVHPYFPKRQHFIDQFWPTLWWATDRVASVLRHGPVMVLHREHVSIVPVLRAKYQLTAVEGRSLDSWKDHDRLIAEMKNHPTRLMLVSGGASGKAFCVRLAQQAHKVVLDVGESLQGIWVKQSPHDMVQPPTPN